MAKKKKEEEPDLLDKIVSALTEVNELRKPHKLATAGIVVALVGGITKAIVLTETFPRPFDIYANFILFIALLLMILDFIKGGFMD